MQYQKYIMMKNLYFPTTCASENTPWSFARKAFMRFEARANKTHNRLKTGVFKRARKRDRCVNEDEQNSLCSTKNIL